MSVKAESIEFNVPEYMQGVGRRARVAARAIGRADSGMKDAALTAIASAIEAAEPAAVDVSAQDNQLHLRLQGTGAIVESGQVRALDIEVPVPGSWVGNRRVTLQLRLTLTPDTEDEDDGPGSPS